MRACVHASLGNIKDRVGDNVFTLTSSGFGDVFFFSFFSIEVVSRIRIRVIRSYGFAVNVKEHLLRLVWFF